MRTNAEGADGLLVVLSDLHIGGDPGQEDFFAHEEFVALLDDLDREPGPVTLLINGDFFEFLQVSVPPGSNRARAIVEHPDHAALFVRLRQWNAHPQHRTVYTVGNHDSEASWNAAIGTYLIAMGIVHEIALGYEHRFATADGARTLYAEHGNEEDVQNAIIDYSHPLIAPVGTYVVTQFINRIEPLGRFASADDATTLSDIDNIYPAEMIPWWLFSNYFYRQARRFVRYLFLPAVAILLLARFPGQILIEVTQRRVPEFNVVRYAQLLGFLFLDVIVVLGLVLLMLRRDFLRWRRRSGLHEPFQIVAADAEHYRDSCRAFLDGARHPAHRVAGRAPIDIFLFGHNHIAELHTYHAGERQTIYGNTGTWMRKLLRVPTRLRLPPVFIPAYELTYITARATQAGVVVALHERIKPLPYRLGWSERLAALGKMPPAIPAAAAGTVIRRAEMVIPARVAAERETEGAYAVR